MGEHSPRRIRPGDVIEAHQGNTGGKLLEAAGLADSAQPTEARNGQAAAGGGAEATDSTPCPQRNAQQKARENCGNGKQTKRASGEPDARHSPVFAKFRDISISDDVVREWSRGESNPRPVTVSLWLLHA